MNPEPRTSNPEPEPGTPNPEPGTLCFNPLPPPWDYHPRMALPFCGRLLSGSVVAAPWVVVAARQTAPSAPPVPPRIVQLDPAEAARRAADERRQVSVETPPGIDVAVFAPDD